MGTMQVVDEIKLKAPAWSRDGAVSILQMMDRAQRFLFAEPCNRTIFIDPATGNHPTLDTTAAKFEYEIPDVSIIIDGLARPIRISKVTEVYIPGTAKQDYAQLLLDRVSLPSIAGAVMEDRLTIKHTCYPALEDNKPGTNKCRVIFPFDPGASTGKMRYVGLIEPLRLTEDTIPLMVEEEFEGYIIEGALAYIEYYDYGRSDRLQNFQENWALRFWDKQNKMNHLNKVTNTPIRPF